MANRRRFIRALAASALIALFLPVLASAQGNYDPWGRDRRGRDNGRYDDRYGYNSLRDVARRLDDRSGDFQRHLDSALDRSRYDDTRREDNINQLAREFRNAASNFRSRVGDYRYDSGRYGNNRGYDEARRLVQLGSRVESVMSRLRLDSRSYSDWSQIRQDLRVVANAYGISYNDRGGWRDGDWNDRNRRNRRFPF